MADNQQHITPTAELIRQYLEGKLDGKTMHALEKQALDDPFLAEALEGYAKYPADQRSALSELQQRLQQRVAPAPEEKKVRRLDYRWLAAASILLILSVAGVMVLNRSSEKNESIAQTIHTDTAAEKKTAPADTTPAPPANANADVAAVDPVVPPVSNSSSAYALDKAAAPPPRVNEPASQPALIAAAPRKNIHDNIRIRGTSSIKDSGALVLMDGIPVSADSINPAEIENVQILKEATASAVYGARAANGVVLITTKKGRQYNADSAFASYNKIDTIHIGSGEKTVAAMLDSKVEGLVTGAKSNFSNYYTDDNVHKISGVVVDEKTGKRIPGVSVSVNGTNRGAVTDTSGSFALHIASKSKAELGFSSAGYAQKKVTVSQNTNNLNVALPSSRAKLNETVVVGYSNKEKKSVTPPYPLAGDEAFSVYLVTGKTVEIPGLKVPQSGKVHISFSVMPDSSLQDFKVLQGMGKQADSIAIDRIKGGPAWMPASNKKKATVEVIVPVELVPKK